MELAKRSNLKGSYVYGLWILIGCCSRLVEHFSVMHGREKLNV